jgi:phenylalanyl-tRNA synthetase beta chain
MRLSLIPGLVNALSYNQNRQAQRVRLFEVGRSFEPQEGKKARECERLAGIVWGPLLPINRDIKNEATLDHVKSDIDRMMQTLGAQVCAYQQGVTPGYLHPGQSAIITLKNKNVGVIGVLHPAIQKAYKLKGKPIVFELDLDALKSLGALPTLHELPKFPSVKRDLALVVEKECVFDTVRAVVIEELGSLLQSVDLFDVYEGEALPAGKKSFALSLILQDLSRTLKEDELNAATQHLLTRLSREVGATLRE